LRCFGPAFSPRYFQECQEVAKAPIKTEIFSWPIEENPWSRIHIDYAGPIDRRMFLIIVDAYSKWPEMIEMSSTTSKATIRQLDRQWNSVHVDGIRGFLQTQRYYPHAIPTFAPTVEGTGREPFFPSWTITSRELLATSSPHTALTTHNSPKSAYVSKQRQFNRHNGSRPKSFEPKETAWVREFRQGRNRWTSATVDARHGHAAAYDVLISRSIQRRHATQMRPNRSRHTKETIPDLTDVPTEPSRSSQPSPRRSTIPLASANTMPTQTTTSMSSTETSDPKTATPQTQERGQRVRQPPKRLQVNPSRKSDA
ncbi:hypothetical protein ANCDUO_07008, partial [Ancylostoma duodenale]